MSLNYRNYSYIELYRKSEDYLFKAISTKTLYFEDIATAYMTAVPVADLNMLFIKKDPSNLNKILSQTSEFYQQDNLQHIIIIPEEFEANKTLEKSGYSFKEQSI